MVNKKLANRGSSENANPVPHCVIICGGDNIIQINKLYSLQDIQPYYYISEKYKVINMETNREKVVTIGKRGYPYVTLETSTAGKNKKVCMHKLVALAFIDNKPYILIEHKDDNKLDYRKENLIFGNHSTNGKMPLKMGYIKEKQKDLN